MQINLQQLADQGIPVWAIVEAAIDIDPVAYAQGKGLDTYSLFTDDDKPLEMFGPWLIPAWKNSEVMEYFIHHEKHGEAICWLIASENAEMLLQHCQMLLYATLPQDEKSRFRFYDPRVLSGYLPALAEQRLLSFFGPVAIYLCADPNPWFKQQRLLAFQIQDLKLQQSHYLLHPSSTEQIGSTS